MYRQFHQEFLLNCDYQSIQLDDFSIDTNELDNQSLKVSISDLDQRISSEIHWKQFIEQIQNSHVVIVNDRPHSDNPIYKIYNDNTQKAYLFRLIKAGISCNLIRN